METKWSDIRPETSYSPDRFTPQVYQQVMSGKPRFSGAQAALEYFGVPDAETRSRTYGDRKQSMVIELIEAGEFTAYPDALRFIIAVKDPESDSRPPLRPRTRASSCKRSDWTASQWRTVWSPSR